MNTECGEMETSGNTTGKSLYDFRLPDAVAGTDNGTFHYGKITVPTGLIYVYNDGKGFHVRIPYTPDVRRLAIRLVMEGGSDGTRYLKNPVMGKHWPPVMAETEADTADIALAASFPPDGKGIHNLLSQDGYLAMYNGSEADFEIRAVKAQNEMSPSKASAGNPYQRSTVGVGLIDYLHSSLESSGLVAKLQLESLSDKVVIKDAYMDPATGKLLLETEKKEENDG